MASTTQLRSRATVNRPAKCIPYAAADRSANAHMISSRSSGSIFAAII